VSTKPTLAYHEGTLGDLVLSLPAILSLSKRLHLAARPFAQELLQDMGLFERLLSTEAPLLRGLYSSSPESLREFFCQYERVCLFSQKGSALEQALRRAAPHLVLIQRRPAGKGPLWLRQLRQAGGRLRLPRQGTPPAGYACLHPGAGWEGKRWPLERFLQLEGLIKRHLGLECLWLLGPAEQALGQALRGRPLLEGSLRELRQALQGAALYVGSDSGPTHLAAWLGVPTVAVFGPTDWRLWRPVGRALRLLRPSLSCAPCEGREEFRRCGHRRCLQTLSAQEVLEAARGLLQSRSSVLTRARMAE